MNQETPQDTPAPIQTEGRGCRRFMMAGGALMLLVCGGCFYRIFTFVSGGPLQVGPETTVVEGPLLPDGRVDYVTALNDRMSEGVTPDNNAAVLLLEAFGPEMIPEAERWEYFQQLGVPELPVDGDYKIGWLAWMRRDLSPNTTFDAERERTLEEQFSASMERPWSADEFPEVAGWLEANDGPLKLIAEATGRPRLYSPFLGGAEPPLISALLPLQQEARAAARLLAARAMLKLGEGDVEGAWEDLLACHRLSRLLGQGETLINDLVAVAISGVACQGSESLAQDARLTAEQARRFAADLNALDPLPDFGATIDIGERFAALDSLQSIARGNATGVAPGLQPIAGRGLDWSLIMQLTNERYDEMVEAFGPESHRASIENLQALDAELQASGRGTMSTAQMIATALIGSRRQVSRQLADVIFALLGPAVMQCGIAEGRAETRLRLLHIALALGAYRSDQGHYPDALVDLTSNDLVEIPLDPFLDAPFQYERTQTGYRLYSVGDNKTDNGGATYDSEPQGDDIIVETPAPEAEAVPADQTADPMPAEVSAGRHWFVSPEGDDAAAGTDSQPLQSLEAALEQAQSGDTIDLQPGVYTGEVQTQRAGVTITGAKDAIVRGPEDERGIEIRHDRTVLRGFTIELADIGVWVFGANECLLEDLMVQDIGGEGVRIKNGSRDNIVRGCRFERMGLEGFDVVAGRKNGEGVSIGTAPEQREQNDPPNVPDRCTGNIVENCTFDTEAGEAVDIKEDSEENIIRHCHAEDSRDPDGGIYSSRGDRNQFIHCVALGGSGHGFRFGGDTVEAGQFGQEEDRIYGKDNIMRNCHSESNVRWGVAPMVLPQDIDDSNSYLGNLDGAIRE